MPEVAEVLVRSQTMCPLLSEGIASPSARDIEAKVENVVGGIAGVEGVPAVQVHYIRGGELAVDVDIDIARRHDHEELAALRGLAKRARKLLLQEVDELKHVSISGRLAS